MAVLSSEGSEGWLPEPEFQEVRAKVPLIYIQAIPVKIDEFGQVTHIGLLMQANDNGDISRSIVSGRIEYGEVIQAAILRHIEKDLGSLAMPNMPQSAHPFTVTQYFPTPGVTAFVDSRQHAISLGYIVPIKGQVEPRKSALEFNWFTPSEVISDAMQAEMDDSQGLIIYQALSHMGIFCE
ncbi:MAG: DUF4916 domain-containing protein [Micrococcaceae bacterium]